MKCPQCGHWNRANFPRCFRCGTPLLQAVNAAPVWEDALKKASPPKVVHVYDEAELAQHEVKVEATLAAEMSELKQRRQRGAEHLANLRRDAAKQGIMPAGAIVQNDLPNEFLEGFEDVAFEPDEQRQRRADTREAPADKPETEPFWQDESYDDLPPYVIGEDVPPGDMETRPITPFQTRAQRHKRSQGPFALAIWLVRLMALGLVVAAAYIVIGQVVDRNAARSVDATVVAYEIEQAVVKDRPGHILRIPGQEGAQIYISELKKSYTVVGGYATISIPDYTFYENVENLMASTMDVTLSPSIINPNGQTQTQIAPIQYTIDIPMSQVSVITPESQRTEVSTSIATVKIRVDPGSRVIINGQDYTDTVDDDGLVVANPPVQAIGENVVSITVQSPYCRQNNMTLVFYRAPQDIPLELPADTQFSASEKTMKIFGTTMAGATIIIETPHEGLDDSALASAGTFSFDAVFSAIGNNTIRIRASYPDKQDSVLEHVVYYLPPASEYTSKGCWSLTPSDYRELLGNMRMRQGQKYECKGTIVKIISEKPQYAIMDTGTDGAEQLVMLENNSRTTWELGKKYRIFADVSGLYDTMPRMVGRYTYTMD